MTGPPIVQGQRELDRAAGVRPQEARLGEDGTIATRTARYCQISQWYQEEGEENRQWQGTSRGPTQEGSSL
jgi:hypothetical protein